MGKMHFGKIHCQQCDTSFDSVASVCPKCGASNPDEKTAREWKETCPLGWGKELFSFLWGFFGLQIVEQIVIIALELIIAPTLYVPGMSQEEFLLAQQTYFGSADFLAKVIFPSYAILFLVFILVYWKNLGRIFKRFVNPKTYWGILTFGIVVAFDFVYGVITYPLRQGQTNQNQNNVMAIQALYPWASLLIFGFIGPFCEECTYRLGLFNLLKRINKWVAYIGGALIFAFIHFNWANAGSAIEWLNIPPYIFSGIVFGIVYDKCGIGASLLAHVINNAFACISSMIQ